MIEEKKVVLAKTLEIRHLIDNGERLVKAPEEGEPNPELAKKIAEEDTHHEAHDGQVFFRAIGPSAGQVTREEFAQAFVDLGFVPALKLASEAQAAKIRELQETNTILNEQLAQARAAIPKGEGVLPVAGTIGETAPAGEQAPALPDGAQNGAEPSALNRIASKLGIGKGKGKDSPNVDAA
ncbi:MAG TPA: hypothetical protein VNH83_28355 [Bryobacteraceae bacterium]|nr:hypothetical protein [Bryobacteraceae bacterium]